MLLSAANFVAQQDLSTAFVNFTVREAEPSSHIMHLLESINFIIGQEATTIGKPMLNTAKMIARVSAMIRCLWIDVIRLVEREKRCFRSCHYCARGIYS